MNIVYSEIYLLDYTLGKKSDTSPVNFTWNPGDLLKDTFNNYHLYQHSTVLKQNNLDQKFKKN